MLPEVVFHLPTGHYLQLHISKKKLKFILIISFTSYWYYTCRCRLNDSLAGFQIVENKALLPHLPFLSHWFVCYLHSFYPIWSLQQKGLFSSWRLKLVWWQSDRNLSCFHAGILECTRFPLGLCGVPHHWGRSASQKCSWPHYDLVLNGTGLLGGISPLHLLWFHRVRPFDHWGVDYMLLLQAWPCSLLPLMTS